MSTLTKKDKLTKETSTNKNKIDEKDDAKNEQKGINWQNVINNIAPMLDQLVSFFFFRCIPFFINLQKLYNDHLKAYHTEAVTSIGIGLILVFFGGDFAMTIAVYAAIKNSGWDQFTTSLSSIWQSVLQAKNHIQKEVKNGKMKGLDLNGDGKLSFQELAQATKHGYGSKIAIEIFTAINPDHLKQSLSSLMFVIFSALATVRSQLARYFTTALRLSNLLESRLKFYAKPEIKKYIDENFPDSKELHKWEDFVIEAISKCICFIITSLMIRIMQAYTNALRGAEMISSVIEKSFVMNKIPWVSSNKEVSKTFFCYALCFYGVYTQLTTGFSVGFILGLPLAPFIMLESVLAYAATTRI